MPIDFHYAGWENLPNHHQWEIVFIVEVILLTNTVRNVYQLEGDFTISQKLKGHCHDIFA